RCEDYDIYLRMARSFPVASHPEIVAEYRWHGGNMSSDYREMLKGILRVHGLEAKHALARSETADDWRRGRQIWRCYYAGQILDATQENWDRGGSFSFAEKGIIQAMMSCPPVAISRVAQIARLRLARLLPEAVIYRLKRLQGKRPPPPLGAVSFGDLDRVAPV